MMDGHLSAGADRDIDEPTDDGHPMSGRRQVRA
jgi:hypothetical protein